MTATGERIVRAGGVALCLEAFGDPADPAVLLLHGAGNDMLSWDERLCERFAAGGRWVVRLDVRDAGRSVTYPPGEPPYGLRDLVADTVGVLDALGVTAAHLVGMSMGGSVGQLVAIEHPGRVASLTLVGTTPGEPGGEQADLPGPDSRLFADTPSAPDWDDRAAAIDYLVEGHRPYSAAFDEPAMRELQARVYDRANDIAANATNHFAMAGAGPWRARLPEIAAPVLVLHGDRDPMFPPAHARALAREIPGAELLLLERTGHEYLPPHTWDVAVPALLRHTSARH